MYYVIYFADTTSSVEDSYAYTDNPVYMTEYMCMMTKRMKTEGFYEECRTLDEVRQVLIDQGVSSTSVDGFDLEDYRLRMIMSKTRDRYTLCTTKMLMTVDESFDYNGGLPVYIFINTMKRLLFMVSRFMNAGNNLKQMTLHIKRVFQYLNLYKLVEANYSDIIDGDWSDELIEELNSTHIEFDIDVLGEVDTIDGFGILDIMEYIDAFDGGLIWIRKGDDDA